MRHTFVLCVFSALLAVSCSDAPPPPDSTQAAGGGGAGGQGGRDANGGGPGAGAAAPATAGNAGTAGSAGMMESGGMPATGGTTSAGGSSAGGGTSVPACGENQIAVCSGTNPVACHFGGDPGHYEVTLEFDAAPASDVYVEVESHRRLASSLVALEDPWRFGFLANVRQPEGQPVQDVSPGSPGLDVYVYGASPALSSICAKPATQPVTIWVAGDSTVCDQSGTDYAGWGQHLPQFFDAPVSVANYADSGESSGSFLNGAALWGAIESGLSAGDWVLIQFGHNDKSTAGSTFDANLTAMLDDVKAAGAHPVLFTPISRVGYALEDEHVNSVGADLPQIIRDLGQREDVPVIDLTVSTWEWLQTVDWKEYFALGTDKTHPNPKGAGVIAGLVRDALIEQDLELADYLR